ncbi:MAG: nucleotidyltransferase domain-containing protein [Nitrospirae bacterium]|nr:nucleotidyltransferase domain-containing protein [Nitrospirota bacterium]
MRSDNRDTQHTILKVLVGSQAHGLAGPDSDADFRSVFVIPTAEMFRLDFKYQGARWMKAEEDETAWEIGQFLALAIQCHPLILETFLAPVITMDEWGSELRALFPAVWSPQRAYEAFIGYGANQRKKLLEKKDARPAKYAAAYIRVLYNLCELLETGTFTIRIAETPIGKTIAGLKDGAFRTGEVVDLAEYWTQEATRRLDGCHHRPDFERVNQFLVRLRKAFLT